MFQYFQYIIITMTAFIQRSCGLEVFEFHKIQSKTSAPESLLIKLQAEVRHRYYKRTPAQVFSCEFWETFKNTYFAKHLQTAASEFWFIAIVEMLRIF